MKPRTIQQRCLRFLLFASFVVLCSAPSFATDIELYPYAGGAFLSDFRANPDQIGKFSFATPGVFGVKGGVYVSKSVQIEGNFGYLNRFRIQSDLQPKIQAFQYEGGVSYNFAFGKFYPYVNGSLGALTLNSSDTANVNDRTIAVYPIPVPPFDVGAPFPATSRPLVIENNDTFFTFSYGGGIKAERLLGPVGFRLDLRGRTTPNFFGSSLNSFEPTAGILLSWGEK